MIRETISFRFESEDQQRRFHERLEGSKTVLRSKELLELVARETGETYKTPEARAAYRAGLSTAAAACDYVAKECGSRNVVKREKAAAAKLCGDLIEGLRATIRVRDDDR